MSASITDRVRSRRSILCSPAGAPKLVAKALASPADALLLDLEDSVAATVKDAARASLAEQLRTIDFGGRILTVRVNELAPGDGERDIEAVLAADVRRQVHCICLPKVLTAADVLAAADLLAAADVGVDDAMRRGIEVMIEDVRAIEHIYAIARSGPWVQSLVFGPGDFGASQGARNIEPRLDDDALAAGRAMVVFAARAYDLQPVDGPSVDLTGGEEFWREARRAAAVGFEAKWAIHPAQLVPINELFAPSPTEVEHAETVVAAAYEAAREGRGAIVVEGRFVDEAMVRSARSLLDRARAVASADGGVR